jgi:hypothetical protein
MLVNPEVQDYLDRLQGRSRGGGLAPGRGAVSTPNYAGEALGGIIRPNVSSFGFRGAIPTEPNVARFRPTPPAANPAERGAAQQEVPGPVGAGARDLGGAAKAAGLEKLGQGIEQALGDIAEKRKQQQENAARANAVPALPTLHPRGGRPGAAPAVAPGAAAAPAPVPYPGAAPITTPAVGPAGGPNPLIGQDLGIRGSAPFAIGGGTSLPLIASAGGTGGTTALAGYGKGVPAPLAAGSGRTPDTANVDPRLNEILAAGAAHLPPGYRVVVNEGYNPGGHVSASQHHVKGSGALDIQIIDPKGNPIPNEGNDPTGMYHQLATHAYGEMLARHPDLKGQFAWGGAFGTVSGGNTPDLMHFDLGGERGHIAENLPSALWAKGGGAGAPAAGGSTVAETGLTHPENNNPFNIKYVGQPGVTASKNTDQGDPQAVYPSYGAGVDEARKLALNKYNGGMTTAASIIAADKGWTPGNMEAAKHVADSMGIGVNDDLKLTDPAAMRSFQRALLRQEQGAGALPYFDQLANAPAQGGAPAVALPPMATAIADINKPPPTVAAAPPSPQPAVVGSAGPAAAPVPLPPPRPDQQSMNVAPPSQQDLLASALAQNQPQAPPPIDPNMLALALQGGGAPDLSFGGGGFFG